MLGSIFAGVVAAVSSKISQDYSDSQAKKKADQATAAEAADRLKQIELERQRIETEQQYQSARRSRLLKADLASLKSQIAASGILSSDSTASILLSEYEKNGLADNKAALSTYQYSLDDLKAEEYYLKPKTQGLFKAMHLRHVSDLNDDEKKQLEENKAKTFLI